MSAFVIYFRAIIKVGEHNFMPFLNLDEDFLNNYVFMPGLYK